MNKWYFFLLALIIRIIFVLLLPQEAPDTAVYDQIASNLSESRGFSVDGIYPDVKIPPLYPFFLKVVYASFSCSHKAIRVIQSILGSFVVIITYNLALLLFADAPDKNSTFNKTSFAFRVANIAALIAVFLPELVVPCSFILTEVLTTFLLCTGLLLLLKGIKENKLFLLLFSGVSFGLTSLCRPANLGLPLIVFAWLIFHEKNWKQLLIRSLIITIAAFTVIAPWTIRNYSLFKRFIPVTVGMGWNLWIGSYQPWEGDYNYKDLSAATAIKNNRTQIEAEDKFQEEALKNIKASPTKYALLCLKKFARFWFLIPGSKEILKGKPGLVVFLYLIHFFILLTFAIGIKTIKRWQAILLLLLGYYTFLHTITFAIPRYRIPVMPAVILISAAGIARILQNPKQEYPQKLTLI